MCRICSEELDSNIREEISQSKDALENAIQLSNDALSHANQVYDEALTLIASINSLSAPDINLDKLRADALAAIEEAKRLQTEIDRISAEHDELLNDYDTNSELGKVLIRR